MNCYTYFQDAFRFFYNAFDDEFDAFIRNYQDGLLTKHELTTRLKRLENKIITYSNFFMIPVKPTSKSELLCLSKKMWECALNLAIAENETELQSKIESKINLINAELMGEDY